jgi:serine/threonine protein kinase
MTPPSEPFDPEQADTLLKRAYITPPGQGPSESDPYRLVGAEITVNYTDWRTEKLRLLKYVGAGGMGAVFYAISPLRGALAVKVLKPDIVAKFPQYAELFSREVAVIRSLIHPNIVRFVGDGRMIAGLPFLVVDWLEGRTLDQHLSSPLPAQTVLTLFEQIGSALAFAHKLKIIHLDVKPENIFLIPEKQGEKESVKVIDFGLSRILSSYSGTTVTRFAGSLHYCSPEHFGGRVSARSDIFSLGVLLHHMLTGLLPIGGSYIAAKQAGEELPQLPHLVGQDAEIAPALDHIIEKATRRDPNDRFQSVEEMLNDLRSALAPLTETDSATETGNLDEPLIPSALETLIRAEIGDWCRREFPALNGWSTGIRKEVLELCNQHKSDFVVYRKYPEKGKILSRVMVVIDGHENLRTLLKELESGVGPTDHCTLVLVFRDGTRAYEMGNELANMVFPSQHVAVVAGWYRPLDNHFQSVVVPRSLHELFFSPY